MTRDLIATISIVWSIILGYIGADLSWILVMGLFFSGLAIAQQKLYVLIRLSYHNKEFNKLVPAGITLLLFSMAASAFFIFIGKMLKLIFE